MARWAFENRRSNECGAESGGVVARAGTAIVARILEFERQGRGRLSSWEGGRSPPLALAGENVVKTTRAGRAAVERRLRAFFAKSWRDFIKLGRKTKAFGLTEKHDFQYCIPDFWPDELVAERNITEDEHDASSAQHRRRSVSSFDFRRLRRFECRPHFLSAEIVARGEAEYLKEVLDAYVATGFDHVFLYLDETEKTVRALKDGVLRPYLDGGVLICGPDKHVKCGNMEPVVHRVCLLVWDEGVEIYCQLELGG